MEITSLTLIDWLIETASPIEVFLILYVILRQRNLEERVKTLEQYLIQKQTTGERDFTENE